MQTKQTVSPSEIQYLSELIHIGVNEQEQAALCADLTSMLDFVGQLDEVGVTDVQPLFSPLDGNLTQRAATPQLADLPQSGFTAETVAANAPAFRLGHFVVPRVLDEN